MCEEDYRKLMKAAENGSYLSIAINMDGSPVRSGFIQWGTTVSGFNMYI